MSTEQRNVDHFYTTNPTGESAKESGYKSEGIAGYVYLEPGTPADNRVPIYRFWSSGLSDHLYTETQSEGSETGSNAYQSENIGWYSPRSSLGGFVKFSRYYLGGPYYDHFLTANPAEPASPTQYEAESGGSSMAGYILPPSKGLCQCALKSEGLYPLYRWYRGVPSS